MLFFQPLTLLILFHIKHTPLIINHVTVQSFGVLQALSMNVFNNKTRNVKEKSYSHDHSAQAKRTEQTNKRSASYNT
jgi:hypothetical protein